MPVHIESIESEVEFVDDQTELTTEQIEHIVLQVVQRIESKAQQEKLRQMATEIRASALPHDPITLSKS